MQSLYDSLSSRDRAVAVVGLGYVGLPLATAMGTRFRVIGFDVNVERVAELAQAIDRTGEIDREALRASGIEFTSDAARLGDAAFVIVAVPTPIDDAKKPDLSLVTSACETIGRNLQPNCIVVLESTVYPGVTEEVCVPILERASGLRCGQDFRVGYSPERINPGDKEHTFEKITKVVAGQDAESLDTIARVYGDVVKAGVHRAPTIRSAEAAKAIENTQRDLNIALMNEFALIFHRAGIDTQDVLAAAGTKWNFLRFHPGLVGGHCIGVDPYYLTYLAEALGYHPEVILAGRRINDGMGSYVAQWTVKELVKLGRIEKGLCVNVLGLTFKENVPDIRNTKVIDVVRELESFGLKVNVSDPVADSDEAFAEHGLRLVRFEDLPPAPALIVAVAHDEYRALTPRTLRERLTGASLLIDVKGAFPREECEAAGIQYRRL